jgi:hypothetical protein
LFLALHCVSEDQPEKAKFYFGGVWNYLQNNFDVEQETNWKHSNLNSYSHNRFLSQLYYQSSAVLLSTLDLTLALKGSLYKMHNLHRFYKSKIDNSPAPLRHPVTTLVLADNSVTDYDEAERAKLSLDYLEQQFPVSVELVDRVHGRVASVFDRLSGVLPQRDLQLRRLQNMIFYQGVKLQLLLRDGADDVAIRNATDVIVSLSNYPRFEDLSSVVGYVMAFATNIHTQLLLKSKNEWDRSLLLDRVRDDYKIMINITGRHKYTGRIYAPMMKYVDGVVRSISEDQLLNQVFTFDIIPSSNNNITPPLMIEDIQQDITNDDDIFLNDIDQFLAEFE